MFAFRDGHWMRRFHVKPSDRRAVAPDYYDFLQEIPLIDEKAIGVQEYRWFVVNALDLKVDNAEEDRPYRLADRYKLSGLGLSPAVHARLDSMYNADIQTHAHPKLSPKLSERIDLAALGLSPTVQAQLDSIFAGPSFRIYTGTPERYDLAQQRLEGRVLYWSLARELMLGISFGSEAFVDARWQSFKESNPFPEYTEAIQAELNRLSTLQPGQPAPDSASL